MHEKEQNIEELKSLDPVQPENRMTVGNLTEGLNLIENRVKVLENIDSNEERIFSTKQGIKKLLACYKKILQAKKKTALTWQMKPTSK
ncbi:tigger transposable element-derived protein 1 [Trichonephila clavipes]|nr:tigger transposable element-derived protein 1 [Trichonephila clavipes]